MRAHAHSHSHTHESAPILSMFTLQSAGILKGQHPSPPAPASRPLVVPRGGGRRGPGQPGGRGRTKADTLYATGLGKNLSRNEVKQLVHLHRRDPVPLTCKPHRLHFFISKNVPFKPLDLSKCRFEFATLLYCVFHSRI